MTSMGEHLKRTPERKAIAIATRCTRLTSSRERRQRWRRAALQ
jgi:hypothetical protein